MTTFLKISGDFRVQRRYIYDKIIMEIRSVSPQIWANLFKKTQYCNVNESFKKFPDSVSRRGWLPKL